MGDVLVDGASVLDDILDGCTRPEHAAQTYGAAVVAADDGYGWARRDVGRAGTLPRCKGGSR